MKGLSIIALIAIFAIAACSPAFASHNIKVKKVDGVRVFMVIASMDEMKNYMKRQGLRCERPGWNHHLLIHVEDEKTGAAIEGLSITANIVFPKGKKISKALDPVDMNNRIDFGNYFDLTEFGNYYIEAVIKTENGKTLKAVFDYKRVRRN